MDMSTWTTELYYSQNYQTILERTTLAPICMKFGAEEHALVK